MNRKILVTSNRYVTNPPPPCRPAALPPARRPPAAGLQGVYLILGKMKLGAEMIFSFISISFHFYKLIHFY